MSDPKHFNNDEKLKLRSVCVACGELKKQVFIACKHCSYKPNRDYEIARALLLAETFIINDDVALGKPFDELEKISDTIKAGRPYAFEHGEQKKVLFEYARFLKFEPQKVSLLKKPMFWAVLIIVLAALTFGVIWVMK